MNYIVRFIKNPFQYLLAPKKTLITIYSVIKGSKIVQNYIYGEHKRIYGLKNKEKTFYLICPSGRTQGLFSIHNYVLWKIRYALEAGYIPVVDYKNYKNAYLEEDLVGKVNAWEYYFEQPTCYSLKDIRGGRNVIICDKYLPAGYGGINDDNEILIFHELIENFCRLNESMREKVKEAIESFLPRNKRVLGVLGRGSDYVSLRPHKHAIVPSAELLIEKIEEKMNEWGTYDFIFLATEDKAIYETLKTRFGDKLITYKEPRFEHDTNGTVLSEIEFSRENDRYLRGEEYLITIYLLAHCESIISPIVGGGLAAIRINGGKYAHRYIFDLGLYD